MPKPLTVHRHLKFIKGPLNGYMSRARVDIAVTFATMMAGLFVAYRVRDYDPVPTIDFLCEVALFIGFNVAFMSYIVGRWRA